MNKVVKNAVKTALVPLAVAGLMVTGVGGTAGAVTTTPDNHPNHGHGHGNYQDNGNDGRGRGHEDGWGRGGGNHGGHWFRSDRRSDRFYQRDFRRDRRHGRFFNRFDVFTVDLSGVNLTVADVTRVRRFLIQLENAGYDGVRLVGATPYEVRLVERVVDIYDINLDVFSGNRFNWNWDWSDWNFNGNYRYVR